MGIFRRILRSVGLSNSTPLDRRKATEQQVDRLRAAGMRIGDNVGLVNMTLDTLYPFVIEIGSNCLLTHATVLAHDASPVVFGPTTRVGRVRILDNVFIGAGAIVLPSVTIGPRAIVGAGAVVTKDVPPNAIVAGNPARVVGTVDDWLARKARSGELMAWEGGIIPANEHVDVARARARQFDATAGSRRHAV